MISFKIKYKLSMTNTLKYFLPNTKFCVKNNEFRITYLEKCMIW